MREGIDEKSHKETEGCGGGGLGETDEECVREGEFHFDLGFDSSFGFSRHERELRVT